MLRVSMELGCFLAGVVLSAQGPAVSEQVESLIQPVKDFLGVLFFASIGKIFYTLCLIQTHPSKVHADSVTRSVVNN